MQRIKNTGTSSNIDTHQYLTSIKKTLYQPLEWSYYFSISTSNTWSYSKQSILKTFHMKNNYHL
jgi:hypothetical protein